MFVDSIKAPFRGIVADFKGRKECYNQDWQAGLRSGFRWKPDHRAHFGFYCYLWCHTFHHWWTASVDCRRSRANGYNVHLFNFAKGSDDLGKELFLARAGWVCVWTALFLFLLAIFNACTIIKRFTRIAGELFGMLIAILFVQQAAKGVLDEFKVPEAEERKAEKYQFQWIYVNGLLGIIFSFGQLFTALKSRRASSWQYGTVS